MQETRVRAVPGPTRAQGPERPAAVTLLSVVR